jgi:L-serine deaminase
MKFTLEHPGRKIRGRGEVGAAGGGAGAGVLNYADFSPRQAQFAIIFAKQFSGHGIIAVK